MPGDGAVVGPHQERVGGTHPPLDRLGQLGQVALGDVQEGRRAGAAVEVLVGAADGEVDPPGVELHRQHTDRVTQVEQHEGPGVVGDLGDPLGVGDPGGSVGDVAERHQRGLRPDHRRHLLRRHAAVGVDIEPAQGEPELGGHALRDVAVGREVVVVEHDLGAPRAPGHGGPHQLVEQDRRRVPDGDLTRRGPEHHAPELVADLERQVEPHLVPAPDQAGPPLALDELGQRVPGLRQRAAQRVAVEVDERAVGPDELLSVRRQRVGPVELLRVGHAPTLSADGLQVFATPDLHVSRRVARVRRDCFSARYV